MKDAKITDAMVKDVPSTTDLLCSPGKYTDTAWKLSKIYQGFGPTWAGKSDFPREAVGITLDGVMIT